MVMKNSRTQSVRLVEATCYAGSLNFLVTLSRDF